MHREQSSPLISSPSPLISFQTRSPPGVDEATEDVAVHLLISSPSPNLLFQPPYNPRAVDTSRPAVPRPGVATLVVLSACLLPRPSPAGWREAPVTGPPGRWFAAATYEPNRDIVVVFGGDDRTQLYNDTWEFDGAGWNQGPASPAGLTPRRQAAMAWGGSRQTIVLVGGTDLGTSLSDTWEYGASGWSPGPPGVPGRHGHAMTYDSQRDRPVLFGGTDGPNLLNDTWELVGPVWTQGPAAPAGLTARHSPTLTFDPVQGVAVLFGGFDDTGEKNGVWLYGGSSWGPGPPVPAELTARWGHAAAWDPIRSATVLFGGADPGFLADTWQLGGSQPVLTLGPSPRMGMVMAAHQGTGRLVLFGGYGQDGRVRDDTWIYERSDYAVAEGLGPTSGNDVAVYDAVTGSRRLIFTPYSAGAWGTNAASGVIRPSLDEAIVTGPGPGAVYGPHVRAFDRVGTGLAKVNFFAYGTLKFGANPATGDVDGDALEELPTGAGPGAVFGPHVRAFDFDGISLTVIARINFFAYQTLSWGVNVATGDVEADGYAELLTGPGPGVPFGPVVRGFDFDASTLGAIQKINFSALATTEYGVNLAGGDVEGDAFDEILCAPGPGPQPGFEGRFRGFDFDGAPITALAGYDVVAFPGSLYGGRVGAGDVADGGTDALLCGAGRDPAADSTVLTYVYDGSLVPANLPFVAFPGNGYGVNVTAGGLGQ